MKKYIVLLTLLSINHCFSQVQDHEGKAYKTTQIGNQTWMAENLRVKTFRNGDKILHAKTKEEKTNSEFDQVIHFATKINNQDVYHIANKENLDKKDSLLMNILLYHKPESLSDTLFVENLTELDFSKTALKNDNFPRLQQLLKNDENHANQVKECVEIHRDILVFKSDAQINRLAKICFECEAMQLIDQSKKEKNYSFRNCIALQELLNEYRLN